MYMYINMYICIYIYICVHIFMYINIYVYMHMYVHMCTYIMYICIYIYICVHIFMYVNKCTYLFIHMFMYIDIAKPGNNRWNPSYKKCGWSEKTPIEGRWNTPARVARRLRASWQRFWRSDLSCDSLRKTPCTLCHVTKMNIYMCICINI